MVNRARSLVIIFVGLISIVSACTNGEITSKTVIPEHTVAPVATALSTTPEVAPYPLLTSALPASPHPTDTIAISTAISAIKPVESQSTVVLWHSLNEAQSAVLVKVIAAFQENYPHIQIEAMYTPHDDLKRKFEQAARSGGGPAILLAAQEWIPDLFDAGLIEDLATLAKADLLDSLAPVGLAGMRYQGALPALPYYLEGVVLFRNQSLIPQPAQDLDMLIDQAVATTNGDVIGAYLDLGPYFSLPHLAACGGKIMDENGVPAFNNDSGICWLELLRSFSEAGLPWVINSEHDAELFKGGRVGLVIDRASKIGEFSEAIGSENLIIDPWPDTADGHLSGFVRSGVLMLNANLEEGEREAGWTFIKFMLSPEMQALLADPEAAGFTPSIEGVEISDRLIGETFHAFEKGTPIMLYSMETYWEVMERAIRAVLVSGANPRQVLAQAEGEILMGSP